MWITCLFMISSKGGKHKHLQVKVAIYGKKLLQVFFNVIREIYLHILFYFFCFEGI